MKRSTLGALALLLVTSSLAQTLPPDDPPVGGGTGGSGGGTGGTGGTGGSGSGGGTGGSGTPSWPYGQWELLEFLPQGTLKYYNAYGLAGTHVWPSTTFTLNGHWPTNGRIVIAANPSMKLRWTGNLELCPESLYVRLSPTAEAQINRSTLNCYPLTEVGRFDNNIAETATIIKSSAFGPLYMSVSPSSGVATVPPITLNVDAASQDFRGPILAKATYAYDVLPQLLIRTRSADGIEPKNYQRNELGVRQENIRDRNGRQILDVAMIYMGHTEGWAKYREFTSSYGAYTSPAIEFSCFENIQVDDNDVNISAVVPFLTTSPWHTTLKATVHDDNDLLAPSLQQETEVRWRFPNDNFKERVRITVWEDFEAEQDGELQFTAAYGDSAHGKYTILPLHWWQDDDVTEAVLPIIKAAVVDFTPWGKLGPLVKVIGLVTPDSIKPTYHQCSPSFNEFWRDSSSYFNGVKGQLPPDDEKYYWRMRPGARIEWLCTAHESEAYDSTGYCGQEWHHYAKWTDGKQSFGYFFREGNG